jgi:hypothetical protein
MARPPTNTRNLANHLERGLAGWVIFFLVVVGCAAIAVVYGGQSALVGVICLAAGAGMFGLLYLILTLMGRWADRE